MGVPERLREALAGRYAVEREIGRGGMAVVYLASDLRHQRPVALKVLLPEFAGHLGSERFQREIRYAARLQHPHILTVLDSGEADGGVSEAGVRELWFTMPFVDGESLRERLRREGPLPVEDALRIASEAARALVYAHQHGVIHRDIKPENMLLTRDGTTLVADFGIARALGAEEGLTQTSHIIGTPVYMSPEQTDDLEIDARTDQYSLAVVLFEMLTGDPPFVGRSLHAIVSRRLSNPTPSARAARSDVPVAVDDAIRKAMSLQPEQRFASVAQFAQALLPARGTTASGAATLTGGLTTAPAAGASTSSRTAPLSASGARPFLLRAATPALVAAVLVAAAIVFPWRKFASREMHENASRVIAVLPFDNLGDSADAYFADGVTDEVRTKLAQLASLEVIARGSSIEYRQSARRPTEIARELGADYLLTGTVRWAKSQKGSRVRVTPELVDARTGHAARTRWVQQFDASLTDVFQVQADIATKVADALGVALADSARRGLTAKPTENLAAYDQFLKGEAASGMMKADQANLRRAVGFFESAVALDSNFALAWSELSRARSSLYSNGVPDPTLASLARVAAERARRLATDASGYLAMGDYYGSVNPIDNARATAEYEQGLKMAPANVELLGAAALTEAALGRWDGVQARLRRALLLDPRSANTARRLAVANTFLRNYPAADSAADRALALAPDSPAMISMKVMVALARGDLDSARAVIRGSVQHVSPETLLSFFAYYQDLYWVLTDDQQRLVLTLPASAFDNDSGGWGIARTELHHLRGDRAKAAIFADSARLAFEEQTRAVPDDGQRRVLLGLALAYLGRAGDAVREGARGVQLMPISQDGYLGPYVQLQLARIYILVGDQERAMDQVEPLLKVPFYLSPGWLRVDPTFDPLRANPRFQRLATPSG